MTDATTRLAEIAEREAFETWVRSHPDSQGFQDRAAWLLSRYDDGQYQWKETHDRWIAWQGATSAAQARSREDAEIMRRAASGVESHNMVEWPGESGVSLRCNICGAPDDIELGPKHTEQCFVTKLRARADELEGRTDG